MILTFKPWNNLILDYSISHCEKSLANSDVDNEGVEPNVNAVGAGKFRLPRRSVRRPRCPDRIPKRLSLQCMFLFKFMFMLMWILIDIDTGTDTDTDMDMDIPGLGYQILAQVSV
jgi:hypothetical protein